MSISYEVERNLGTPTQPDWSESFWMGDEPATEEEAVTKLAHLPVWKYRIIKVTTETKRQEVPR